MSGREVFLTHPIPPLCGDMPRVLILGSFPSVKSREIGFFYGHPQNRFWRVMASLLEAPLPQTVAEKTRLMTENGIALWDVIASCSIVGSADSTISQVTANDLTPILAGGTVRQIFVNGKTAARLYERHLLPQTAREAICLPSTSPANASWSLERLVGEWAIIKAYL